MNRQTVTFGFLHPHTAVAAGLISMAIGSAAHAGAPFVIATAAAGQPMADPGLLVNSAGSFIAEWNTADSGGVASIPNSRLFGADGTAIAAPFDLGGLPRAMDRQGEFIVPSVTTRSGRYYVAVQRYAADGSPQGGPIQVGESLAAVNPYIQVAMDDDGDFTVGWTNVEDNALLRLGPYCTIDYEASKTYVRVYNNDGTPKTLARLIDKVPGRILGCSSKGDNFDWLSSLAMNNARQFVVGLVQNHPDGSSALAAQTFDSSATSLGPQTNLATSSSFEAYQLLTVGIADNGTIAAAWVSEQPSPAVNGVLLSSSGSLINSFGPMGSFLSTFPGAQLSMGSSGAFAVAWGDSLGNNIQFFNADGSLNGTALQIGSAQNERGLGPMGMGVDANGNAVMTWLELDSGSDTEILYGQLLPVP